MEDRYYVNRSLWFIPCGNSHKSSCSGNHRTRNLLSEKKSPGLYIYIPSILDRHIPGDGSFYISRTHNRSGFGLFALFSVLRYRTDTVPIREMTYLFVMVALPIMNSILYNSGDIVKLCLSDFVIIAVLFILEQKWGFRYEQKKLIKYEKIDLIRADEHDRLIEDLINRTGLAITQVEIVEIDFIRDSADIIITYEEEAPVIHKKSEF